jgi:tetratricopeptide (TPR) repeat protein
MPSARWSRNLALVLLLPAFTNLALPAQSPQTAADYVNRGNASFKKGDLDQAITSYTQAIRLNSGYALAFVNRAMSGHARTNTTSPSPTTPRPYA